MNNFHWQWALFAIPVIIPPLLYQIYLLKSECEKITKLRKEERIGRTRAEQTIRTLSQEIATLKANGPISDNPSEESAHYKLLCSSIGVLQSCFDQRNGTPRNFGCSPAALSQIKLHNHIPIDSLEGLTQFSHFW